MSANPIAAIQSSSLSLISANELADRIGMTADWIRRHSRRGLKIPCVKLGGVWRYDPAEVEAWIKQLAERQRAS